MTSEEKSAQYLDLNTNERLLEIQEEIVKIEKKRIDGKLSTKEAEELKEKLNFLVTEQRMLFEARYSAQKDIKKTEKENIGETFGEQSETKEIKEILEREIEEDQKIEGELKEIIQATKERKWYETWWGKILIIVAGTLLLSLLTSEPINFSNLVS